MGVNDFRPRPLVAVADPKYPNPAKVAPEPVYFPGGVNGSLTKAANVPAATVPFADLTAAANSFNALRTALVNAGFITGP